MDVGTESVMELNYCYSVSCNIRNGVINCNTGYSLDDIVYVLDNYIVILNKKTKHQIFLHGHDSYIKCLTYCKKVGILVSISNDEDKSIIIFWETNTWETIWKIKENCFIYCIDMNNDASFLVAIKKYYDKNNQKQWISILDIEKNKIKNILLHNNNNKKEEEEDYIKFHNDRNDIFITNGKKNIYVWKISKDTDLIVKQYAKPIILNKSYKISYITMTSISYDLNYIFAGSKEGELIIWKQHYYGNKNDKENDIYYQLFKKIKIPLSIISYLDVKHDVIILGGDKGSLIFIDMDFKFILSFDNMTNGYVNNVSIYDSFNLKNKLYNRDDIEGILIGTTFGEILECNVNNSKINKNMIMENILNDVSDIDMHPMKKEMIIINRENIICKVSLDENKIINRKYLIDQNMNSKLIRYSRDGKYCVLANDKGSIIILKEDSLDKIEEFKNTNHEITQLKISNDSKLIAIANNIHQVLIYGYIESKSGNRYWEYFGKCQSHIKDILSLEFGNCPNGYNRLFSLGSDDTIVEYDVINLNRDYGIKTINIIKKKYKNCKALFFVPPISYNMERCNQTELILIDDDNKFHIYNPDKKIHCGTYIYQSNDANDVNYIIFQQIHIPFTHFVLSFNQKICNIRQWPFNLNDNFIGKDFKLTSRSIKYAYISCDGSNIVILNSEGEITKWNLNYNEMNNQSNREIEHKNGFIDRFKYKFHSITSNTNDKNDQKLHIKEMISLFNTFGYNPSHHDLQNIIEELKYHDIINQSIMDVDFETCLNIFLRYKSKNI